MEKNVNNGNFFSIGTSFNFDFFPRRMTKNAIINLNTFFSGNLVEKEILMTLRFTEKKTNCYNRKIKHLENLQNFHIKPIENSNARTKVLSQT